MARKQRALRLFISGHVQGVGFRYWVQEQAIRLGLSGFTRNLSDGRVEVLAQGEDDALNELARWCAIGPRYAEVNKVERNEVRETMLQKGFDIRCTRVG